MLFGSGFFGAADSGVKFLLAAATTFVEISAETLFGGRQTLSLHAW